MMFPAIKNVNKPMSSSLQPQEIIELKQSIRCVPNFPKHGINFRDITTLLENPRTLKLAIDGLTRFCQQQQVDWIAGIEARGFIFATAIAYNLDCAFLPIRKAGKLPADTHSISYSLEYGEDKLEIHKDAIKPGQRVVIVDDLLATGGTAHAAVKLLRQAGATVVGACFVVELEGLHGKTHLQEDYVPCCSLCHFPA